MERAEPSEIYTSATSQYTEEWIDDYTASAHQMANGKPFCLQLCVTKGTLEHALEVKRPSIYCVQVNVFANDEELSSFVEERQHLMREIVFTTKKQINESRN